MNMRRIGDVAVGIAKVLKADQQSKQAARTVQMV